MFRVKKRLEFKLFDPATTTSQVSDQYWILDPKQADNAKAYGLEEGVHEFRAVKQSCPQVHRESSNFYARKVILFYIRCEFVSTPSVLW